MTHTSTEQPELLPCPFCGCKPKLVGAGLIRWIKCPEDSECGSSGMAMGIAANDLSRGIAAWNRRAPASQARVPLIDALAEYDKVRDHVAEQVGCLDGGCLVKRPKGMHTNGGCKCSKNSLAAQRMMYVGQRLAEAVRCITQEKQG